METKKFNLGEISLSLLDSLDTFHLFKEKFIQSLIAMYGDDQADEFYQSHTDLFDEVERVVMEYLRIQFCDSFRADQTEITL